MKIFSFLPLFIPLNFHSFLFSLHPNKALVTRSGSWNWSVLNNKFPDHIKCRLAAIIPPGDKASPDMLRWKY